MNAPDLERIEYLKSKFTPEYMVSVDSIYHGEIFINKESRIAYTQQGVVRPFFRIADLDVQVASGLVWLLPDGKTSIVYAANIEDALGGFSVSREELQKHIEFIDQDGDIDTSYDELSEVWRNFRGEHLSDGRYAFCPDDESVVYCEGKSYKMFFNYHLYFADSKDVFVFYNWICAKNINDAIAVVPRVEYITDYGGSLGDIAHHSGMRSFIWLVLAEYL